MLAKDRIYINREKKKKKKLLNVGMECGEGEGVSHRWSRNVCMFPSIKIIPENKVYLLKSAGCIRMKDNQLKW